MIDVIFSPEAHADLERLEEFLWTAQDPLATELLAFLLDGLSVRASVVPFRTATGN